MDEPITYKVTLMYNGQATYTVEASGEESAVDSALAHWRNASSNTTCTKFEQVVHSLPRTCRLHAASQV